MGNDGRLDAFILAIALALMLGIPVIGALVAARLVFERFLF